MVSIFHTHGFTAQLAGCFAQDSSSSIPAGDSWLMHDNFLGVRYIIHLYCHSVYIHHSAVLFSTLVVRQQLSVTDLQFEKGGFKCAVDRYIW